MPERREDDQLLIVKFSEFVADNNQWRLTTDEYRKNLCIKVDAVNLKIDDINRRLYSLPCEKQVEIMLANKGKINWLWAILCGVILAIVGAYVKG